MDPSTLQVADVQTPVYWRTPFDSLSSTSDLAEFLVLDIEPSGPTHGKYILADAQVVLNSSNRGGKSGGGADMDIETDGSTADTIYHTRTHLGRYLQPGDTVKGYFLRHNNFNNPDFEALDQNRLPDIVLVKKSFPVRRKKNRRRNWKLKSIAKEAEDGPDAYGRGALGRRGGLDQERVERDYENFLRDLEEDPELRATINLYKTDGDEPRKSKRSGKADSMEVEDLATGGSGSIADNEETDNEEAEADFPDIRADELLDAMDDLKIED